MLRVIINHGIAYLRLTASLGLKKVEGRVVQRCKVVLSLGPMSRHDDGMPDYLRRLRESYKAGKPLIKELEPYVDGVTRGRVRVAFESGDTKCLGKPKRMAATVLDPVFNALGLDELFASVKHSSKIGYDLTGIVRLLTYGRLQAKFSNFQLANSGYTIINIQRIKPVTGRCSRPAEDRKHHDSSP